MANKPGNATPNQLATKVRTRTGKGASRQARRDGLVPVVLYGSGTDPQHLVLNARDFAAILRKSGTNAVLTLDIEGKEQLALPKVISIHPIRRSIEHADLIVIRRGEKVTVEVNVIIEGEAANGALVTQDATSIEIEADAMSIPESLVVSIDGVEEGTQIQAGQIELPEGVTLVSDPEMLVVNIVASPTSAEMDEAGGEESAEAAEEGEAAEGESGKSE